MNWIADGALTIPEDALFAAMLVFCRVAGMVALLPGWGERALPVRIKLSVAVALTTLILVILPPPTLDILLLPAIATETLIGLLIGLSLRLALVALQFAGAMIAQSASLSQVLGVAIAEPTPAVGQFLIVAGIALIMAQGAHIVFLELALASYAAFPLGSLPTGARLLTWGVSAVGLATTLAFSLAAPFLLLSTVYNMALGVINRAMPQLMVAFVGAPAITLGGIALMVVSAPFLIEAWFSQILGFAAFAIPGATP